MAAATSALARRSVAVATASASAYLFMTNAPLRMEEKQPAKLSIYSAPPEPVVLAEVRGPLEDQVASARRAVLGTTQSARGAVQGQVDRWIGVEKAVEDRVSSLIPNDEPITPGILYVGIATLSGSVFTRYRALPLRLITPPLLFVGSLNYFLPKTAHNVAQYYVDLEARHLPGAVREQRLAIQRAWNNTRSKADEQLHKARETSGDLLQRGLQGVEQNTGLKVGGSSGGVSSGNTGLSTGPNSDPAKRIA